MSVSVLRVSDCAFGGEVSADSVSVCLMQY
jgi:hypothetical protein